jgi:hypothetical protein
MSQHQITVERPWANIPTKQLINTETGQTEVFVRNPPFADIKVAQSGANNQWEITDKSALLQRYNNKNSTNITEQELNKKFFTDGTKQFNNDRAAVINKISPENTKTFLATKENPVPGTIDPKTGIKAGQTSPTTATDPSTTPDGQAGTTTNTDELNKESATTKDGTRTSYATNMKYPLNLRSEVQDVIKFSILEYSPSLAKENQGGEFGTTKSRVVTLEGGDPIIKGSKRIGVITLPIPAGISDSNPVGWENDTLNMLQSEAANLAKGFFEGGVPGAGDAVQDTGKKVEGALESGELKTKVASFLIGAAVQQKNIGSRAYGAVDNNNVELLFSGPSLRTFSFTFLFYPREPNEAKMVRQIIRAFKQAMSVKRSATSLLLKAPHTFAIQYMTAGQKAHPYLNRFKECALTSCNVDYTPDGTYMTYDGDEKSMTAYRLGLTFQELEPIFDDEYGPEDNIGF